MSSLLVRFGLEYAPQAGVEHQLLANLFNSYTFPDNLPITELGRVLSRQGADANDHLVIGPVQYFLHIQSNDPVTVLLKDMQNNIVTLSVDRVFNLVGSQLQAVTLANSDANDTVSIKVVYS